MLRQRIQLSVILAVSLWLVGCQPESPAPAAPPPPAALGTNAGFTLVVSGMHCDGCAAGIRSELARVPGVTAAEVNFKTGQAQVACDPARVTAGQLLRAITEAGYQAQVAP